MIETIQMWIWNIGGFLFTVSLIVMILAWINTYAVNRLTMWTNKESRENLLFYLRHREEIWDYIKEKKKEKM